MRKIRIRVHRERERIALGTKTNPFRGKQFLSIKGRRHFWNLPVQGKLQILQKKCGQEGAVTLEGGKGGVKAPSLSFAGRRRKKIYNLHRDAAEKGKMAIA